MVKAYIWGLVTLLLGNNESPSKDPCTQFANA